MSFHIPHESWASVVNEDRGWLDGRLPKVVWNVEFYIQNTNKREILDAP